MRIRTPDAVPLAAIVPAATAVPGKSTTIACGEDNVDAIVYGFLHEKI
jgi:hypothetical protein